MTLSLARTLIAVSLLAGTPALADVEPDKPSTNPFELDHEMAQWAARIAPASLSPLRRLRAISQALLDPRQIGLREVMDFTPTAIEAFRQRRANCVGFASLFVGLAREAEVPAFFVMIEDLGTSQRRGSLLVTEGHLAAAYGPPGRLRIFDFGGESDGDRFRVLPVTDLTAIALYFSNRGVEAMLAGHDSAAVRHLRHATELAPSLAPAWINLGVARRRQGDFEGAESAYQRALAIDPGASAAYRSLAALLRVSGRPTEADAVMLDAERRRTDDPLSYLNLAQRSLKTGDVDQARGLYRKALELSRRNP